MNIPGGFTIFPSTQLMQPSNKTKSINTLPLVIDIEESMARLSASLLSEASLQFFLDRVGKKTKKKKHVQKYKVSLERSYPQSEVHPQVYPYGVMHMFFPFFFLCPSPFPPDCRRAGPWLIVSTWKTVSSK